MIYLLKKILPLSLLLMMISCTPSAPYEVRSPCVAVDAIDAENVVITPCVRRPVNAKYDIA